MDRCLLCGHHPADHHPDCPDAGRVDPTVDASAAPAGPDRDADAPAPETPDTTRASVPWSIPIREPQVRRAAPVDDTPVVDVVDAEQRRLVVAVTAGAVVLFALIAVAVLMGGDGGDARPATEVAGSEVTRAPATSAPSTTPSSVTTTTEATTTTTTTSTTTAVVEERSPETAAVAADTGDVPILEPGEIGRGWVAQVSSVPVRSGGSALQTAYETVRADASTAVVIRSDEWPALRNGFWVIVIPDFASGAEAVAGCDAAGRPDGDECFGRFLSAQRDQNERVCRRADDGSLTGDCSS